MQSFEVHGRALLRPSPLRGLRILVVEDDATTSHLIRERLASSPTPIDTIECVASISDAIFVTTTRTFDIVLLDLGLTDSPDPAGTLSKISMLGKIPVIVVTGHDSADLWYQAVNAGAQDFLSKDSFVFRPGGAVYLAHVIVSSIFRYNSATTPHA